MAAFDENNINWTKEEKQVLQNAVLTAKIDKIMNPGANTPGFMASAGGAALITVLIGGIFGSCITHTYQEKEKDREFQQAWLKARGDQAMVGYKDFLEQQQETVKKIFAHIGALTSASEDFMTLSKSELTPASGLDPGDKKIINEKRAKIREKHAEAKNNWLNERDALGMFISYYFPGERVSEKNTPTSDPSALASEPSVLTAWNYVKEAVSGYSDCAEKWGDDPAMEGDPKELAACAKERTEVTNTLEVFNKSLEKNRKYTWEGWESPEKLKAILEKSPVR